MLNPWFVISGIGMMAAGLLPVFWWRYRTLVPWRDFFLGAGFWGIAIAFKVLMDVTVTPMLAGWLSGIYTAAGIAIIIGAYAGLRTGFLESGLTYLLAFRTELKKMDYQQAVAFGLGFGCAEAFILGISSFLNVSVILAFPQMIDLLPPDQRAALLQQLSMPTIVAFAPIIERVFTILAHVFCSVLVIQAVRTGRFGFFMLSFLFKTGLDGMLPMLTLTFDRATAEGIYSIEAFVAVLGLASLGGMFWLRGRYGKHYKKTTGVKKSLLMVSAAAILILLASALSAQPDIASPVERRNVNFDDFQGRYDFVMNNGTIGYSKFDYVGNAEYNGADAFVIKEETNFSAEDYRMYIEGVLYVTADARPLFYNMTIHKNGDSQNVLCRFGGDYVKETVNANGTIREYSVAVSPDSFIIANNMISHWALLFRAVRLEKKTTYIVHIFSPNIASGFARPFDVTGVTELKLKGRTYEAYVFEEQGGNRNYITPEGLLLKITNHRMEIVLSNGDYSPRVKGFFR